MRSRRVARKEVVQERNEAHKTKKAIGIAYIASLTGMEVWLHICDHIKFHAGTTS